MKQQLAQITFSVSSMIVSAGIGSDFMSTVHFPNNRSHLSSMHLKGVGGVAARILASGWGGAIVLLLPLDGLNVDCVRMYLLYAYV